MTPEQAITNQLRQTYGQQVPTILWIALNDWTRALKTTGLVAPHQWLDSFTTFCRDEYLMQVNWVGDGAVYLNENPR